MNSIVPDHGPKKDWKKRIVVWDRSKAELHTLMDDANLLFVNQKTKAVKISTSQGVKFYTVQIPEMRLREESRMDDLGWFCCDRTKKPDGKLFYGLTYRDAYVEYGKIGSVYKSNAFLVDENGERKEIDLAAKYITPPHYDLYSDKHLIAKGDDLISSESALYWLRADNQLQKMVLPVFYWEHIGEVRDAVFTRKGLVINSAGARYDSKVYSGVFNYENGKLSRIFGKGEINVDWMNVSHDGCSIAFVACDTYAFHSRKSVKVIDVCEGN